MGISDTEFYICPVDIKGISKDNWFESSEGTERVMREVKKLWNTTTILNCCGIDFKINFIFIEFKYKKSKYKFLLLL